MKRFIITGAPGAGKTAIIRQLEREGFSVVEEAATDVIASAHARGEAEPWTDPLFIDAVADLQRQRQRGNSLAQEDNTSVQPQHTSNSTAAQAATLPGTTAVFLCHLALRSAT